MKKALIDFYLDWTNNFVSTSVMANHYGLDQDDVVSLIQIGKKHHEESVNLKNLINELHANKNTEG